MTSMLEEKVDEIINEIDMSQDNKPWLILEGENDERFFMGQGLNNLAKFKVAHGWENVKKIIETVKNDCISNKVFGVIDRDYREYFGEDININEIVQTDFRDIEIMMFFSPAFEKVIKEHMSEDKIPKKDSNEPDFDKIKEAIFEIAKKIAFFRFYCQQENKTVKLSKLNFKKFLCNQLFIIKKDEFIKHINGFNNSDNILEENWTAAQSMQLPEKLEKCEFLLHGHDVMNLVAEGLRIKWGKGSNNSKDTTREKIEQSFRLAYSRENFQTTEMYNKLHELLSSKD